LFGDLAPDSVLNLLDSHSLVPENIPNLPDLIGLGLPPSWLKVDSLWHTAHREHVMVASHVLIKAKPPQKLAELLEIDSGI